MSSTSTTASKNRNKFNWFFWGNSTGSLGEIQLVLLLLGKFNWWVIFINSIMSSFVILIKSIMSPLIINSIIHWLHHLIYVVQIVVLSCNNIIQRTKSGTHNLPVIALVISVITTVSVVPIFPKRVVVIAT